jgi:hypothetical protein
VELPKRKHTTTIKQLALRVGNLSVAWACEDFIALEVTVIKLAKNC